MSKVSAKDVVNFFKEAELEVAELVLEFGANHVTAKREAKAAVVNRMAKARAGRGKSKGKEAPAQAGRAAHAPAPAHTAAATSEASDREVGVSA